MDLFNANEQDLYIALMRAACIERSCSLSTEL